MEENIVHILAAAESTVTDNRVLRITGVPGGGGSTPLPPEIPKF
jgi:putative protein kinase ArgK-like GTPase of G3E family